MSHLLLLTLIIAGSGILGGIANYHRFESNLEFSWFNIRKSLLFGIIAAAAVPLFLHMLHSKVITEAKDDGGLLYFVIAGFCLVAAFFSTRFLETLGDKVMSQLEEVKQKTEKIEGDTEENSALVDVLVGKEVSAAGKEIEHGDENEFVAKGDLEGTSRSASPLSDEEKIVQYFQKGGYSFRTFDAISSGCNIGQDELKHVLASMKEKNKIREFSNRSGSTIFALTS
jgi:hypothetical protein